MSGHEERGPSQSPRQAEPRARPRSSGLFHIGKAAATDFSRDQCTLRAAALSYYIAFALPPLLIVLIKLAGVVWSPDTVQHAIESEFAGLIGVDGARAAREMVSSGSRATHGVLAGVLGIGGLLAGATGAFLSLQDALNAVWQVRPDPTKAGVERFIMKRLLSIGMVMAIAFLLVVSLAVTAAIAALGRSLGEASVVILAVNAVATLAILSALFAAMFKLLPDAVVQWRSVWVGGVATAVLFEVGKSVIGLYLGHSRPGNAFGSASALAVILVWIYYAGMLLLFGAEFTEQYAHAHGHPVRPSANAVSTSPSRTQMHDA